VIRVFVSSTMPSFDFVIRLSSKGYRKNFEKTLTRIILVGRNEVAMSTPEQRKRLAWEKTWRSTGCRWVDEVLHQT
jgi:hypothetical protein